jgi:hypothetical protein
MDASAKSRLSYLLETPVLTENSVIGSTGIQGEHRYWKVISRPSNNSQVHRDRQIDGFDALPKLIRYRWDSRRVNRRAYRTVTAKPGRYIKSKSLDSKILGREHD